VTDRAADPLAGIEVDPSWERDPAAHPELAPWRKLAAEWNPEKALERIETKSGFIFSNVALVATLATGLGLAAGVRVPSRLEPLAATIGGLLGVALALALVATWPSWQTSIPLKKPDKLKMLYERRITFRGWFVRLSLLAYSGAFVAAIVLALLTVNATTEPSLALRKTAKGGAVVVTGTVAVQGLTEDAQVSTALVAVEPDGAVRELARDFSEAGTSRTVTVTLIADPAPAAGVYRLSTAIRDRDDRLNRSMDLAG
jgi:hypothetical protein